jgi:uncharacterized protein (DUF302 family)
MPDGSNDTEGDQQTPELTTKTSPRSVADTVARLQSLAEGKGMKVFAVIDHSGEAERVGLQLRDTKVVIFGSPRAGTPVMAAAPLAALDLPLKVLVFSDDGGQTKLAYTTPSTLAARYGLDADLAARLAGIDRLTDGVIGG